MIPNLCIIIVYYRHWEQIRRLLRMRFDMICVTHQPHPPYLQFVIKLAPFSGIFVRTHVGRLFFSSWTFVLPVDGR